MPNQNGAGARTVKIISNFIGGKGSNIMKHIFYFIGILFIIYELKWIMYPKSEAKKSEKLHRLLKEHKEKKWDNSTDEFKEILKIRGLMSLLFVIWMFAGLLTFNWVLFLISIVFNIAIVGLLSKALRFSIGYIILHWLNSIIGFTFGVFVIINSYHLKINLYDWIIKWF